MINRYVIITTVKDCIIFSSILIMGPLGKGLADSRTTQLSSLGFLLLHLYPTSTLLSVAALEMKSRALHMASRSALPLSYTSLHLISF